MSIIRKTSLAIVALSVAGIANAGTYTPPACTAHPVTIPCEDTAWDVGFEAFFVEATANDQGYVVEGKAVTTGTSEAATLHEYKVTPDYEFGFELEGSYHFSTGNDIIVSWERLHQDNHDSMNLSTATDTDFRPVVGAFDFPGTGTPDANTYLNSVLSRANLQGVNATAIATIVADARHDFDFDAVNFEFGQHIDVGNDYDVRIHGGFQWARIDYTKAYVFTSTGNDVTPDALVNTLTITQESDFDGFGVRFGTDMAYNVSDGFSVVGHAAMSLLVGDIDTTWGINNVFTDAGTVANNRTTNITLHQCEDSVVVPAFMGKVGLHYQTEAWDGHVSLEGGWRFEGYYHAVRVTQLPNLENFTFHGPFIAIKYTS